MELREDGRHPLRLCKGQGAAHHAGDGTGRRAEIALVGCARRVIRRAIGVAMGGHVVVPGGASGRVVAVPVAGQRGLGYNLWRGPRTLHADGERPPDREEHGQQQQEPDAKCLHDS